MLIDGTVRRVFKQNGNWASFLFEDKEKDVRVANGSAPVLLMPGMKLTINGEYVDDPKYGIQIKVSDIDAKSSPTAAYLSKCLKGVGDKLACEIVKTLGEDCIGKIKEDNSVLLNVKGIKKKKYKQITESLNTAEDIDLYLSIFSFFNGDITTNQADKIREICKSDPKGFGKIKENPYWLIAHVEGFGFKKVDKLALASGLGEFSVERIGAAIIYVLQQMSQTKGHCFTDMDTLSKEVSDMILADEDEKVTRDIKRLREAIDYGNTEVIDSLIEKDRTGKLSVWKDKYYRLIDVMVDALSADIDEGLVVAEDERIYWIDLYKAEKEAASIIRSLVLKRPVRQIRPEVINEAIEMSEDEEGCELSEEQKRAVHTSLQNRLSIITGGPGRGKTTIIKTIIKAWNDDGSVICLAPTGKAAKRMEEATGHEASTIHRYRNNLRKKEKAEPYFDDCEDEEETESSCPKDALVIVDEVSMIGIKLGRDVLKLARDCNIIFVGDVDQLASIEPGCFMKDMIRSKKIPVSRLTKGFRNAGSVAINSDLINKGKHLKSFVLDEDTKFVEAYREDIVTEAVRFYKAMLKTCEPKDIGILTPMRVRGFGSVDSINKAMREKLNPATETNVENDSGFLVGDRVMNTKNQYNKEIIDESGYLDTGIFNGDSGTIEEIDYENNEATVLFDDGRRGIFTYEEMKTNFIPAYAITIHKSQGSEYKHVLVIVSSQHAFFLKRNLVYTAFSRARQTLEIVGDEKAIALAARNMDDSIRNTLLCERIMALPVIPGFS